MNLRNQLLASAAVMDCCEEAPGSDDEYDAVCDLFEDFHGYPPRDNGYDIVELDDGTFLAYVGKLSRIGYETDERDPDTGLKENLHTFGEKNKNARPLLYVDADGQIVVLQGEYTFTEGGFEG